MCTKSTCSGPGRLRVGTMCRVQLYFFFSSCNPNTGSHCIAHHVGLSLDIPTLFFECWDYRHVLTYHFTCRSTLHLTDMLKQQEILNIGKAGLAVNQIPKYVTTHQETPDLFPFKAPADESTETVVRELEFHFLFPSCQCWLKAVCALAKGRAA